jgi:hypothetical protein
MASSRTEFDKPVLEQVVKLRETEEKKWAEISSIMDLPVGKLMLAYGVAKVKPKDRIKDPAPRDIVRLRDDEVLSWGDIMCRTGLSEGAARALYTEGTGKDTRGLRIGKGGRHPGSNGLVELDEKPAKPAKKAPAKRAPAGMSKEVGPLQGLEPDAVKPKLEKYAIQVDTGSGIEVIKVKQVKRVAKGTIVLVDADTGASRTIKQDSVVKISRKTVV